MLYAILATYVHGPTLKIIRSVELHNGLACWGALISHLEPRSRQRALALLEGLTSLHFGKRTITEGIYEFERLVQEYELAAGSGTRFNEELKIATLLRNAPNSVKSQLQLALGPGTTYTGLHNTLISFHKASMIWVNNTLGPSTDTVGPMEIDRVEKGKGKGKEKGKGKGQGKGSPMPKGAKGKGKSEGKKGSGKGAAEVAICWNCGKKGHLSKDCWSKSKQQQSAAGGAVSKQCAEQFTRQCANYSNNHRAAGSNKSTDSSS